MVPKLEKFYSSKGIYSFCAGEFLLIQRNSDTFFAVISLPALWLLCCCFLLTTSCSAEIADFSWCSLQGREDRHCRICRETFKHKMDITSVESRDLICLLVSNEGNAQVGRNKGKTRESARLDTCLCASALKGKLGWHVCSHRQLRQAPFKMVCWITNTMETISS